MHKTIEITKNIEKKIYKDPVCTSGTSPGIILTLCILLSEGIKDIINNEQIIIGNKKFNFFFLLLFSGKINVKYIKKTGNKVGPNNVNLLHNVAEYSVCEISTIKFV